MDWPYYTLGTDGFLRNENGEIDIFENGKPVQFSSESQAEEYLNIHDIRGTVK